jgi:putative hydrolase of the HAD superfamily
VKYLGWARRPAVIKLLWRLKREGIPLGVLSDYPAEAKLQGLALSQMFSVVACTTDRAINAFKPHPRGFLHACELLRLDPADVAYVGDRADVDGTGAQAAGMTCYLVGRDAARSAPRASSDKEGLDGSRRFEDLERICFSVA